jgi:predicted nicotinamide N-methyase
MSFGSEDDASTEGGKEYSGMEDLFREPDSWREDTFEVDHRADDEGRSVSFQLKGLRRDLGQTLQSTGLTIWRASFHLNEYIFHNPQRFIGKSVCELGCGLGVVSILVAKMMCDFPSSQVVVATDGDDDTLALLQRNIDETSVSSHCRAEKLCWGDHTLFLEKYEDGFDVLLGADIIYEAGQVASLMSTVAVLLKKPSKNAASSDDYDGGFFFLAFARRNVPIDKVISE